MATTGEVSPQTSRVHVNVQLGELSLPFFAEYPYFVWGEVNYDSDGDCKRPTDRTWKWLYLRNRVTDEVVEIERAETSPGLCSVEAVQPKTAYLAAFLTAHRTGGLILGPSAQRDISADEFVAAAGAFDDLTGRLQQADAVRRMFLDPALAPFDSPWWWGGWKWIRRFASEFAEGLRTAMLVVQQGSADEEMVALLRAWWDEEPEEEYRDGLRIALKVATGIDPASHG